MGHEPGGPADTIHMTGRTGPARERGHHRASGDLPNRVIEGIGDVDGPCGVNRNATETVESRRGADAVFAAV